MAAGRQQVAPGAAAQPQDFPAQARRPSMTAQPEIVSATTPSVIRTRAPLIRTVNDDPRV